MVFPDQWKIAHVIALFKKGDKYPTQVQYYHKVQLTDG
jgi:hypothetical protein